MKQDADFSRIPARHDEINLRLEHWAQWVSVRPQSWKTQPMFRLYKAPPQWEPRELRAQINTLEASETERIVSMLPSKHRAVLRWLYVWPWVPVSVVRRELALTKSDLVQMVPDARDMVINRLKQRIRDNT